MDLEIIERLMRMLANSEVEELEVTEGNLRIRLAKGAAARRPPAGLPAAADSDASARMAADNGTEPDAADDLHTIVAGLPGTFYRAPAPGAEPFVGEGDAIRDGQQLAIVEAMKMMNPVEADCDGMLVEILIDDAAPVQAGAPLFRVRKAGP
jgi:acetyl-CoA carboxylase biotin carboxyl carrier protein